MKIESWKNRNLLSSDKKMTASSKRPAAQNAALKNRDVFEAGPRLAPASIKTPEAVYSATPEAAISSPKKEESEPIVTESGFVTSELIQGKIQDANNPKPSPQKMRVLSKEELAQQYGLGEKRVVAVALLTTGGKTYVECIEDNPYRFLFEKLSANRHLIYNHTGTEADDIHNGKMAMVGHDIQLNYMNRLLKEIQTRLDIPEDFTLDWNASEGSLRVGGIEDEAKRKALEKALVNTPNLMSKLNGFCKTDMIVNDRVDELTYGYMNQYLKKNFNLSLRDLSYTESGGIQGGNDALNRVLSQYDGKPQNAGYPELPLWIGSLKSVLPGLIESGGPAYNPVFHYSFTEGQFQFETGDVKIGSGQLSEEQRNDRELILRMQYEFFIEKYYLDKRDGKGIFKQQEEK